MMTFILVHAHMCQVSFTLFVVYFNQVSQVHLPIESYVNLDYVPSEKKILNILGASEASIIDEDDSKISEVVVPSVSFCQVQEAMSTLPTFLQQQHQNNVSDKVFVFKENSSPFPIF